MCNKFLLFLFKLATSFYRMCGLKVGQVFVTVREFASNRMGFKARLLTVGVCGLSWVLGGQSEEIITCIHIYQLVSSFMVWVEP